MAMTNQSVGFNTFHFAEATINIAPIITWKNRRTSAVNVMGETEPLDIDETTRRYEFVEITIDLGDPRLQWTRFRR